MEKSECSSDYCRSVLKRLESMNFSISSNIQCGGFVFTHVCKQMKFEIRNWAGPFIQKFFIITEFSNIDIGELLAYSRTCFAYALSNRKSPLPWGIYHSAVCYSVAICDSTYSDVVRSLMNREPLRTRKGFGIPVIYDIENTRLYYPQKTPELGTNIDPLPSVWRRYKSELTKVLTI